MKSIKLIKAVILIYIVGVGVEAIGDTVNVDDLTPGSATGDVLTSQGVTFTSGAVNTDAVSTPENLLSVGLVGASFDYALFQVTGSGAEGFDDRTYSPVSMPATEWLFSLGLGAIWIAARRPGATS